jgi:hypothetical protein
MRRQKAPRNKGQNALSRQAFPAKIFVEIEPAPVLVSSQR